MENQTVPSSRSISGSAGLPILIVSIAVGIISAIAAYSYFMPYWIMVERVPPQNAVEPDLIVVPISGTELLEYPALKEAINSVEQRYQSEKSPIAIITAKTTSISEGQKTLGLLAEERQYYEGNERYYLRYQGNDYSTRLVRSYDRPMLIEG